MTIKIKGCHITASNLEELNRFARDMGVSKCWYSSHPQPHYQVICCHTMQKIERFLEKKNKKRKN